jgi:hypothetical protein
MSDLTAIEWTNPTFSPNSSQPSTWWQVWQKVRAASLTPGGWQR